MYERTHLQEIKKRLREPRKCIQVLYGPRQVGKTTLMKQLSRQLDCPFIFVSADEEVSPTGVWLSTKWEMARLRYQQLEGEKELVFVIDEVQHVEDWAANVKREWDADTWNELNIKVILLGSSTMLIQRGLTESLLGRFELIPVGHWTYGEMHDAFGWDVDTFIWYGGYPGAATYVAEPPRWKEYVYNSIIEASVSRDVLMTQRVDKPILLRRLFEIGTAYSAQILSLNKMMLDLQERGNLATLSNYLTMLDAACLLGGLQKYSGDIIRKRSAAPKLQTYNNALRAALSGQSFEQARSNGKEWGRVVESAVGAHLINVVRRGQSSLYYWNESSREVDFVLEHGGQIIGLEVKSGKDASNPGMALFAEKFRPKAMFTVGTGGIPLEEFLRMSPTDLF